MLSFNLKCEIQVQVQSWRELTCHAGQRNKHLWQLCLTGLFSNVKFKCKDCGKRFDKMSHLCTRVRVVSWQLRLTGLYWNVKFKCKGCGNSFKVSKTKFGLCIRAGWQAQGGQCRCRWRRNDQQAPSAVGRKLWLGAHVPLVGNTWDCIQALWLCTCTCELSLEHMWLDPGTVLALGQWSKWRLRLAQDWKKKLGLFDLSSPTVPLLVNHIEVGECGRIEISTSLKPTLCSFS